MALRRVFSLSHAPPGNGLAAKDFFVTYFDPTLSFTSHERDRFHEWTRSIVVRTLKHRRTDRRTRCNDLIFVQRNAKRSRRGKMLRCQYKRKKKKPEHLWRNHVDREEAFSWRASSAEVSRAREKTLSFEAFDRIDGAARRGAGYSRNSKVYSSLKRLVVLTWFLLNEASN